MVGEISIPRFGKALKPVVERYGLEHTHRAMQRYATENAGRPRDPAWFAQRVVEYLDQNLVGPHGELTPDALRIYRGGPPRG